MRVVAWVPDLMDRSRFGGADVVFVNSAEELAMAADAAVLVADLGRAGATEALAASAAGRRVGFISHVLADQKAAAEAAGIEVYNRSVFFSRIVGSFTHPE